MSYNLYHLYKKQFSEDGGTTWYDVEPLVTVASGSPVSTGYSSLTDCENMFKDYLVMEALEDNFRIEFLLESGYTRYTVEYSIDNRLTWHSTPTGSTHGGAKIISPPAINTGDKIYWRGNLPTFFREGEANATGVAFTQDYTGKYKYNVSGNTLSMFYGYYFDSHNLSEKVAFPHGFFAGTDVVDASGLKLPRPSKVYQSTGFEKMFLGCTSLTTPPDLTNSTVEGANVNTIYYDNTDIIYKIQIEGGNLEYMFSGCISLTETPNFSNTSDSLFKMREMFNTCTSLAVSDDLPIASNNWAHECFRMFSGCTSLTTAPELPGTILSTNNYYDMFLGCTSLTTAPSILPATDLKNGCYLGMFNNCTNLTTAPELPATILAESCYDTMFCNCSSLNQIKCMATDISEWHCTYRWVYGVSQSGTFIKSPNMSGWSSGESGIPDGWSVQNA